MMSVCQSHSKPISCHTHTYTHTHRIFFQTMQDAFNILQNAYDEKIAILTQKRILTLLVAVTMYLIDTV